MKILTRRNFLSIIPACLIVPKTLAKKDTEEKNKLYSLLYNSPDNKWTGFRYGGCALFFLKHNSDDKIIFEDLELRCLAVYPVGCNEYKYRCNKYKYNNMITNRLDDYIVWKKECNEKVCNFLHKDPRIEIENIHRICPIPSYSAS